MIITRTPFRISFFGGKTDLPAWYENNGPGAVLSTTIDKYCYISCRVFPPFFEHKYRVVWSKIELAHTPDEIEHPTAREVLKFLNIKDGIEVHHHGDLPARSGLGSSSAFTVGLLHALHALEGRMVTKRQLALDAMHVEQERAKLNVGSQDQVAASFGGFNKITFGGPERIHVQPLTLAPGRSQELQRNLLLFFTGLARNAHEVEADSIRNVPHKASELRSMVALVDEAIRILNSEAALSEFGKLLHETWQLKRSLSREISSSAIDDIYAAARSAGAVGGKLLGAGGGGFMLFYVEPESQSRVREKLSKFLRVPFRFENLGSQIVYYSPDFSKAAEENILPVESKKSRRYARE